MKPSKKGNGSSTTAPATKNFFDNFWDADQFFSSDFFNMRNRWLPAVNIKDNKNNFEIEVSAPGYTKKDFVVKVENGMLCISAKKEETKEEKKANYTRKEFSYNTFERSFSLPENANAANINATYTDGILRLTLKKNKVKKSSAKKITVK